MVGEGWETVKGHSHIAFFKENAHPHKLVAFLKLFKDKGRDLDQVVKSQFRPASSDYMWSWICSPCIVWKRPNILCNATALPPAPPPFFYLFVYSYCSNTLTHLFAVLLGLSLLKISDPSLSRVQYKHGCSQKGRFCAKPEEIIGIQKLPKSVSPNC